MWVTLSLFHMLEHLHIAIIFRAPITINLQKVAPLEESLVCLHKFWKARTTSHQTKETNLNLHCDALLSKYLVGMDARLTNINEAGRPVVPIFHGRHFMDAMQNCHNKVIKKQDID